MKNKISRNNRSILIRIFLSFLIFFSQLFIPINDILCANNGNDSGVVGLSAVQEQKQSPEFPFIPGDAIMLSTYPDTTSFLNGIFAIDDQGFIEFPIGDRILIVGMTEENFLQYLRNNYQNYMRSPNLFVKPMIRVTVAGGFATPGLYYVDKKMSFWDLIRMAGGPNHEGAVKDINWERNGERVIEDVTPFLEHGVSLNAMGFQSGDLVWAPSPEAEDTWDFLTTNILPIATFTTSLFILWMSYQTTVLIARGR